MIRPDNYSLSPFLGPSYRGNFQISHTVFCIFLFIRKGIPFDLFLKCHLYTSGNSSDVILEVDYITKLENYHWQHDTVCFKTEMDVQLAETWRERLEQTMIMAKGNNLYFLLYTIIAYGS